LTKDAYDGDWVNDRKHGKGSYKYGYKNKTIIYLKKW
jgi:hypothetical protein